MFKHFSFVILLLPTLALGQLVPRSGGLESGGIEQPLPADEAFRMTVSLDRGRLLLHWAIEDGYYLYRKSFKVSAEPASALGSLSLPAGEVVNDEFFGEVEVYRDEVEGSARLVREHGFNSAIIIDIEYQGCAEDRYCYPVTSRTLSISP